MVPMVSFGRSGLRTSRLAFGLSRLHHMPSTKARQDLLAAAADLGFRHFDAARAYGDGLAERELGAFLQGRRNNLVVATKFGIPAHPLIERVPAMRTPVAIARKLGWRDTRPPMSATALRDSIAQSLRALRIDTIDILFLHEPVASLIAQPDELRAEMQRQKASGAVKCFGVAGNYAGCVEVSRLLGPMIEVVQTYESDWKPDALVPDLTFGAMRRGPQSRLEKPLDETDALADLRAALKRRPNGSVIVSTRRTEHLRALAQAAEATA
jgi:aryl-alcohol dehydrogenase-like predicted oxidoreductase